MPALVFFPMLSIVLVHLIRGDCIYKVPFIECVGEEGNGRKKVNTYVVFVVVIYCFYFTLVLFKGNID